MRLSRITVEMFRGVPMTRLRIETRVLRAGRRIQSVEANLFDEETQVARATGLRIRIDPSMSIVESTENPDSAMGVPPEKTPPMRVIRGFSEPPGFIKAVDLVRDDTFETGQAANLWVRLRCRLIAGEDIAPIEQLATIADFASGTGNAMDYMKYTSINPDLTLHVNREPRSDWIGIRGNHTARSRRNRSERSHPPRSKGSDRNRASKPIIGSSLVGRIRKTEHQEN